MDSSRLVGSLLRVEPRLAMWGPELHRALAPVPESLVSHLLIEVHLLGDARPPDVILGFDSRSVSQSRPVDLGLSRVLETVDTFLPHILAGSEAPPAGMRRSLSWLEIDLPVSGKSGFLVFPPQYEQTFQGFRRSARLLTGVELSGRAAKSMRRLADGLKEVRGFVSLKTPPRAKVRTPSGLTTD